MVAYELGGYSAIVIKKNNSICSHAGRQLLEASVAILHELIDCMQCFCRNKKRAKIDSHAEILNTCRLAREQKQILAEENQGGSVEHS